MPFFILVIGRTGEEDSLIKALTSMDAVRVVFMRDWEEACEMVAGESPQVVIIDGIIIRERGVSIISRIKRIRSDTKILIVAKCPTVEIAVGSVKAGADEFLVYPPDIIKLRSILKNEVEVWRLKAFGKDFFQRQREKYDFSNIYGESPEIKRVFQLAKKIIPSRNATILICGETGTGKGLIARAIHYNSGNGRNGGAERPFVEINCTAIPENLLESELFGFERGAFTDAKNNKKGLFELADGGTIFLDEIGHMDHNLQIKLLKVVEEKNFRRLGGVTDIHVDLRIIAGTNMDLETAIENGRFRKDLYYRLNVFTIRMPLLKERGDDIKILARHFLEVYNREHHRTIRGFSKSAMDLMMNHDWPGNVRELKNAVERAVLMAEGDQIEVDSLPIEPDESVGDGIGKDETNNSSIVLELGGIGIPLEIIEREVVERVLRLNRGNKSRTARALKISRPKLLRMIKKYSINS
jgi:DNA-binding NtrC family response regulator